MTSDAELARRIADPFKDGSWPEPGWLRNHPQQALLRPCAASMKIALLARPRIAGHPCRAPWHHQNLPAGVIDSRHAGATACTPVDR